MSTFLARAKTAVLTETTKEPKKPYVAIDFASVDDPKRVYPWTGFFGDTYGKDNKSTTERTLEALRRCGWKGNDVSDLSSVIGVDVDVTIKEEEYNGVKQIKVAWISLPGEGGFKAKPLEQSKAKDFARSIAGFAKNVQAVPRPAANGSGHPNAPGNSSGPSVDDSEVPF
jgi:hypothetical protein